MENMEKDRPNQQKQSIQTLAPSAKANFNQLMPVLDPS